MFKLMIASVKVPLWLLWEVLKWILVHVFKVGIDETKPPEKPPISKDG